VNGRSFSARKRPNQFGAMAGVGHEERFPPTRLSAGCEFRKETIAGMRRNGRDAPKADLCAIPTKLSAPDSFRTSIETSTDASAERPGPATLIGVLQFPTHEAVGEKA
jgi:hypothetical protein